MLEGWPLLIPNDKKKQCHLFNRTKIDPGGLLGSWNKSQNKNRKTKYHQWK